MSRCLARVVAILRPACFLADWCGVGQYRELRCLLTKELGIVLRPEEMRRLVDAFDTNEVCSVTYVDIYPVKDFAWYAIESTLPSMDAAADVTEAREIVGGREELQHTARALSIIAHFGERPYLDIVIFFYNTYFLESLL